jgi:asparagine synthase (glutamine-hydrolysing)
MCGITGIFNFDSERHVSKEVLKKMADTLAHRGPDGEGFFIDAGVGLAHRRLSIIDLEGGNQPMFNQRGDISIVFNGEIYNYIELKNELIKLGHSFVTNSDTEVIIKAYEQWGFACQDKLNGMWAFAIWDTKEQHMFLSRDRLGEKPLNYMLHNNTFLFGSEIKSILAYTGNVEPDTEMHELYMFLGYIPAPYTYYKSVRKLEAGNYLVVKRNKINEYSYWDLPDISEHDLLKDENQITTQLNELLYDSVNIRMRSDVPYGAFLSGGLDSSCIVSKMSEISSFPVKTFTIGFNEKRFDERDNARIIADLFKTEHTEEIVDKSSLDKSIQNILHHFDEPFADPAAIPTSFLARNASKHVKMVLTGDGGDEVFAGYSHYQSERFASIYQKSLPGFIKNKLPQIITVIANIQTGNNRYKLNRIERVLKAFNLPFNERLITKFVKIPPNQIKELMLDKPYPIEDFISTTLNKCKFNDSFNRLNYYNLKVSLPDQMLVKVDKMSMANSLETRAPLLDYRIAELMYQVDKSLKMPTYTDKGVKHVLKSVMKNKLPDEILNRKKQGFEVPLREWFKDKEFENVVNATNASSVFKSDMIKKLTDENSKGQIDHGTLLWRIVLLNRWLNKSIA